MCQLVTLLTDAFLNKLSEVISKICLLKQITHFTSQRKLQALCHSLKRSTMRASSKYRLMSPRLRDKITTRECMFNFECSPSFSLQGYDKPTRLSLSSSGHISIGWASTSAVHQEYRPFIKAISFLSLNCLSPFQSVQMCSDVAVIT